MKRSIYSIPEPFSLSPILCLVPSRGKVGRLESQTSSLFARYEKVQAVHKELLAGEDGREHAKSFAAEALMLKEVLDWLSVSTEDAGGSNE